MSWSYSGNPKDSIKDEIRFLTGDTVETDSYLTDEEIEYIIEEYKGYSAKKLAIECLNTVLPKLAREVDYKIGSEQVSCKQAYDNFYKTLKELKQQVSSIGRPTITGNATKTEPLFKLGEFDYS